MKLFIHIGLHKTGTSTLQNFYFPYGNGYTYLGRHYKEQNKLNFESYSSFLVSDETLIGRLVMTYEYNNKYSWIDQNLETLKKISIENPQINLIMGIRKPIPWIKSIYKHYVKYGGTRTFNEFLDALDTNKGLGWKDFYIEPRIKFIKENFLNAPFIYDMEYFFNNINKKLNSLSHYLTGDTYAFENINTEKKIKNIGLGNAGLITTRFFNQCRPLQKSANITNQDKSSKILRKLRLTPYKMGCIADKITNKKPFETFNNQETLIWDRLSADWSEIEKYITK